MKRNPSMYCLKANYLFPEITRRTREFLAMNPEARLISLGIGDTTEPIPASIADSLSKTSLQLGTCEGYLGYGPEQGGRLLREKIASNLYGNSIQPDEVFISDGAKCDLGRLQMLFGGGVSIAVQDPSYPVYVEGSLINGVEKIVLMRCNPENQFFPDLAHQPRTDLIYFCSPNNPTGAVATKEQLLHLVEFATANRSIIIFDAAYSTYIQDPMLPKSIFEIEGATRVAIEVGSFSKLAGFTGIRLGWTIVPEQLTYDDGSSVRADWNRVTSTVFNGASNIAQSGGCAIFEEDASRDISSLTHLYLQNASIIKSALERVGYRVFGGKNAPYLWVYFEGEKSWEVFQRFLEQLHIITTPGSGFGVSGEGWIRFSAFGHRQNIIEAAKRLGNLDWKSRKRGSLYVIANYDEAIENSWFL